MSRHAPCQTCVTVIKSDLCHTGTEDHSESETIADHLESLASDIERVR